MTTSKKATKSIPQKRAAALKNVLTVTVIDGKYYCACTSQNPTPTEHQPLVKMDDATEAALRELGVKFKKGKANADS
jgi:hypothetical protein